MADLRLLFEETKGALQHLARLRKEIDKQLDTTFRQEFTTFQNTAKEYIADLNLHDLFTELANAELDCSEHFRRFPDDISRHSKESNDDWEKCYNRKNAAMDAIIKVALTYVRVARDVMEE